MAATPHAAVAQRASQLQAVRAFEQRAARAATLAQAETPVGPVPDAEYDPFEVGDFTGGWAAGVAGEFVGPAINNAATKHLPADRFPWLYTTYGSVVRKKGVSFAAGILADAISQPIAWGVRSALHRSFPGITNDPGPLGIHLPPANKLAGRFVKGVATGMARTWLTESLQKPQPPAPAPPPPLHPDAPAGTQVIKGWVAVAPDGKVPVDWSTQVAAPQVPAPVPPAKQGPKLLGHDLREIANDTAMNAVGMVIGAAYDQTVGPVVQRGINTIMGRKDEPINKPAPLTPGGVVNALTSGVIGTLLMRPVTWKGPGAGFGPALATSMVNGLIATAIDSVYSRGVGTALEDAINGIAGLPRPDRKPETATTERLVRTVLRGAVSTGAAFAVEGVSQALFAGIAAHLGGPFGALVAMAGPSLTGMVAGTIVDSIAGAQIGKLGGTLYSWVTGKPKSEDRPRVPEPAAAAPAPAPAAAAPVPAAPGAAPARARKRARAQVLAMAAMSGR